MIEPDELLDDEDGVGDEWGRQEAAHRFLEREFALGFQAKQKPSGLIVGSQDSENPMPGQYL